jgi:regulator of protease activity HflC (stomatin/prohibitin superfamily)
MLSLNARELATGVIEPTYGSLSPERDDYLVTGDTNILHASLTIKYRISNVIDYVTNVYPMPDPKATVTSKPYHHYNEYTILRNLARNSVIEAAGKQAVLDIRGSRQDQFLLAVAASLKRRLQTLADRGAPLGIEIVANGVIAPKGQSGKLEAIMPPRQTQEVFDQVFKAQTQKSIAIQKARSEAEALLLITAGQTHEQIAGAIEQEFALLRKVSAARTNADSPDEAKPQDLREQLNKQRQLTESLLADASGSVRSIIRGAEIQRDRIVKEVRGDYQRFIAVLPEYLRNPRIFMARLQDETRARALSDNDVVKMYVPPGAEQYRLHIPQDSKPGKSSEDESDDSSNPFQSDEPAELVKPS